MLPLIERLETFTEARAPRLGKVEKEVLAYIKDKIKRNQYPGDEAGRGRGARWETAFYKLFEKGVVHSTYKNGGHGLVLGPRPETPDKPTPAPPVTARHPASPAEQYRGGAAAATGPAERPTRKLGNSLPVIAPDLTAKRAKANLKSMVRGMMDATKAVEQMNDAIVRGAPQMDDSQKRSLATLLKRYLPGTRMGTRGTLAKYESTIAALE